MLNIFTFWLGIMVAFAGCNYSENPDNNLLVGMCIIYAGAGIAFIATIQLAKRRQ